DARTIAYLRMTARPDDHIRLVEAYARAQHLWRDEATPVPDYDAVVRLDLAAIRPSIAGPRNPEDRIDLDRAAAAFKGHLAGTRGAAPPARVPVAGRDAALADGDVVIAAITSCTNASTPPAMIAAGLLARNAGRAGLATRPWVKTSLAPGSHVVAEVLERTG